MSDCKKTSRKATLYTNCEDFIKAQHINLYHYLLYSTTVNIVWFLDTISSDFLHTPEQKQSPHVAARFFFISNTHNHNHKHTPRHTQANNLPAWNNHPWFHYLSNRKQWSATFSQDVLQYCHQTANSCHYTLFQSHSMTHTNARAHRKLWKSD